MGESLFTFQKVKNEINSKSQNAKKPSNFVSDLVNCISAYVNHFLEEFSYSFRLYLRLFKKNDEHRKQDERFYK